MYKWPRVHFWDRRNLILQVSIIVTCLFTWTARRNNIPIKPFDIIIKNSICWNIAIMIVIDWLRCCCEAYRFNNVDAHINMLFGIVVGHVLAWKKEIKFCFTEKIDYRLSCECTHKLLILNGDNYTVWLWKPRLNFDYFQYIIPWIIHESA